ncbi:MAG: hypothetical protein R2751_20170 [Bacteroidales bacterium]
MVYTIAFRIHMYVSALTLLGGFLNLALSIRGLRLEGPYSRRADWSSLVFLVGLYFQLILGFVIYFTLRGSLEGSLWHVADTENDASLRFWAIEHIALMLFALFLSQLGRIYIRRSTQPVRKHKASLFYYGTSLLLILFSVGIALFFR